MEVKIKNIILLFAVILVQNFGCSGGGKLQSEIASNIESQLSPNDSCLIDMTKLTSFSWDTLYYLSSIIPKSDVKSILQNRFKEFSEFNAAIVFLNHGKVVYYEIIKSNPEMTLKNEIIFSYVDSLRYSRFSYKNSIFYAKKISTPQGYFYYSLFPKTTK